MEKNVHSCLNSIPLEGLIGLIFERNTTFLVTSQYFSENIVAIIFGIGIAGVRTPNREVNGVKKQFCLCFFLQKPREMFCKEGPRKQDGPAHRQLTVEPGELDGVGIREAEGVVLRGVVVVDHEELHTPPLRPPG